MDNILEIKNLDLFFRNENKEHQALYDINLSFEKGKIHSIVGESGCGKTMTAMSVMRLLPKTAYIKNGEIIFNGENLLTFSPIYKRTSMFDPEVIDKGDSDFGNSTSETMGDGYTYPMLKSFTFGINLTF